MAPAPTTRILTAESQSLFFDFVAAELIAHRRQQLVGKRIVIARAQSLEQRQRNDGRGDAELDGIGNGPTSLARIGYIGSNAGQRRILFQRVRRKIQQPRAHDAAVAPDLRYLMQVELEFAL